MEFLNNPALQASVIPFVVALLLGLALASTRYLALAVVSGLVAVLALTIGFTPVPLTAVTKLWLACFGAALIALALEAAAVAASRRVVGTAAAGAGLAAVWMLLREPIERQAAAAQAEPVATL